MTPEDLIQSLPPLGGVLREAWNKAWRDWISLPQRDAHYEVVKSIDNASALAVARVAVEHVLRELKMKPEPGELPRVAVQCWGCEGKPSGDNNPCDVCGRRSIP